jgi:hypothetical protein
MFVEGRYNPFMHLVFNVKPCKLKKPVYTTFFGFLDKLKIFIIVCEEVVKIVRCEMVRRLL